MRVARRRRVSKIKRRHARDGVTASASRPPGGGRVRRLVPLLRPRLVRHRRRADGGRRPDRPVRLRRGAVTATFRAGAAATNVDPPLGLPMIGVVRRPGAGCAARPPLEVTAAAFERRRRRGSSSAASTRSASSRPRSTSCATGSPPRPAPTPRGRPAQLEPHPPRAARRPTCTAPSASAPAGAGRRRRPTSSGCSDAIVTRRALARASGSSRPRCAWGSGAVDEAVNRRERGPDGHVVASAGGPGRAARPPGPVACRRAGRTAAPIATVVGYGCHTVTTGHRRARLLGRLPGRRCASVRRDDRRRVRLPAGRGRQRPAAASRSTTTARGGADRARGSRSRRVHALADRPALAAPARAQTDSARGSPIAALPLRDGPDGPTPALAAAEERVDLPAPAAAVAARRSARCGSAPTPRGRARPRRAARPSASCASSRFHGQLGAPHARRRSRRGTRADDASRARCTRSGSATARSSPAPGEIFTEIGLAVKERSPGRRHALRRLHERLRLATSRPRASTRSAATSRRTATRRTACRPRSRPEADRLLVETGSGSVARSSRTAEAPEVDGWLATGAEPQPLPAPPLERPPSRG